MTDRSPAPEGFKTDNLEIAAYICARTGRRWSRAQRHGRVYFFFDELPEVCRDLRDEFLGGGEVVAQDFVEWRNKANQVIHADRDY